MDMCITRCHHGHSQPVISQLTSFLDLITVISSFFTCHTCFLCHMEPYGSTAPTEGTYYLPIPLQSWEAIGLHMPPSCAARFASTHDTRIELNSTSSVLHVTCRPLLFQGGFQSSTCFVLLSKSCIKYVQSSAISVVLWWRWWVFGWSSSKTLCC